MSDVRSIICTQYNQQDVRSIIYQDVRSIICQQDVRSIICQM